MALRVVSSLGSRRLLLKRNIDNLRALSTTAALNSSNACLFPKPPNLSSAAHDEIKHHAQYADDWWNETGSMKGLHSLNAIRVPFIRDGIIARGVVDEKYLGTTKVLSQQKILEVGCGGGILTEQLARLGGNVTGIDLGKNLIETATAHLNEKSSDLKDRISYKVEAVEKHAQERRNYYDAVVVSEVLEHVDDKPQMLTACAHVLKPGGSLFITTLNKTVLLWICGIALGENVLNLVPPGTHHWDKLISPLEVQRILDTLRCQTVLINGSTYDFWKNSWRWINTTNFCYALQAIKLDDN